MYHVLSKVTGDTWNWKIVRSPSTSGGVAETAEGRRVVDASGISLRTISPRPVDDNIDVHLVVFNHFSMQHLFDVPDI